MRAIFQFDLNGNNFIGEATLFNGPFRLKFINGQTAGDIDYRQRRELACDDSSDNDSDGDFDCDDTDCIGAPGCP